MRRPIQFLFVFGLLVFMSSCKIFYPNMMFKQKDYQYFELAQKEVEQYIIKSGDQFSLRVFSRDGFKLIDVVSNQTGNVLNSGNGGSYLVDNEGFAKLPIIGEFYVYGYTEAELERILEEKYSNLFVDPYVMLTVSNRRAFVFKGSTASVVTLNESPTNLFEVIAKAGGIGNDLKAYKIKVIRGDLKNPQITLIDLSSIEGMRNADLIVQSNDIIYIEPRRRVASDVLREVSPILAWVSTILTTVALIRTFSGK